MAEPGPPPDPATALAGYLRRLDGPPVVLTGAGMSTDSGIPDYRGPDAPARMPMTISEFRSGPTARQRYWARSHVGWQRMDRAAPNAGHLALAGLQREGRVGAIITQNVDGLDERAGATSVIDLHGRLDRVICLDCGAISARPDLAARLAALNPGYGQGLTPQQRPDGDVELADTSGFVVADCLICGGVLKPDVVFFGENVPPDRVARCYALVDTAPGLLVLGSSLTVQSGLRFVRRMHREERPVAIVNRGSTRGDEFADLKLDAGCSQTLGGLLPLLDPVADGTPAPG
ncbi:NAD-dependent protein deacetylase [Nakamurella lactea]|uniref:NAD-dependent protein deacetylase n=1 Tax=Nakamurella lactea TaxID=459515 RepID=UPI00041F0362